MRWTSTITVGTGTYRFATSTDDGVRLSVDGGLRIDKWIDQGTTEWTADVELSAGDHAVIMEYYENGWDAVARMSYGALAPPGCEGWQAEYFTNPDAAGRAARHPHGSGHRLRLGRRDARTPGIPADQLQRRAGPAP